MSDLAAPHPRPLPRTLLLTLVFAPDGVSTAHILTELALQLRRLGHRLTVHTTTPHYNPEPEALRAQPMRRRWGGLLFDSTCRGIPVHHARVKSKGKPILGRLLNYVMFHAVSTASSLLLGGRFDLILVPSPPLTTAVCAIAISMLRGVPFIYNVQEIYPDIAHRTGVIRDGWLLRMLEVLERFIYRRAHTVVVISEKFRRRLVEKGVPDRKLRVIPNFADVDVVQPAPRNNAFAARHGLKDRFVLLYAGNIGLTQDFETLLTAAEALRSDREILFVIVGDGARREWLARRVSELKLENVLLLPYQSNEVVPQIYASCDVGLVTLRKTTALDTFPSKVYTIMAAGRPSIVAAEPDTELAAVVEQARCGQIVRPEDPEVLRAAILQARSDARAREEMGRRGREYVVQHHSPAAVARQYDELLRSVSRRGE
jgi:colanic acid biosynthesis glycosyl transferase WcaI